MGSSKSNQQSSGSNSSQTTYTPTPEERGLEQNQLDIANAGKQGQIDVNNSGLSAVNNLLQGKDLPGYLQQLPYGISPDVTQGIVNQSLKDIQPYFQSAGLLDSGVNAAISARTSADIRNQASQYNLNNLMQLLNIGVGGQASVQQPISANNSTLAQSLAGLRTVNQSGNFNSNTNSMTTQPFSQTFAQFGQGFNSFTGGLSNVGFKLH